MKRTFRSLFQLRLIYLFTTLFLVVLSFFVFKQVESLIESSRSVTHTKSVSLELEKTMSSLFDAQSAQRGYLITHDSLFIEVFNKALQRYPRHLENVRDLTIDNPIQQQNVRTLEHLSKRRVQYMLDVLDRDKTGELSAEGLFGGKVIMDSLRTQVEVMNAIEDKLLLERTQARDKQSTLTPMLLLSISLGALAILLYSYFKLQTQLTQSLALQKIQRLLVEEAPAFIGVMRGPEHIIELANEEFRKIVGPRAIVGKTIREAFPEVEGQGFFELMDNVYRTGTTYSSNESAVQLSRGSNGLETVYVNLVFRASVNEKGIVEGLLLYGQNITEQISARKQIEESEARYHNLIHTSPSAIGILKGEDFVITTANHAIIEIWGKGAEIIGKKYFEALPELAEQGYKEIFAEVYKTGKPFSAVETPVHILHNGKLELKYYNFILYAQRNAAGEIEGIGIIATEVTSQALVNKKIQESEGRFRLLAEALPQLVWVTDAQGINEYTSERWEEYTGVKPGGPEEWIAIVHPDDLEDINHAWMTSLSTGNTYKQDVRLKSKTGEYRWFTVNGEPVRDQENKILKWVGAFTDVHTEKQFSEQLEKQVQHRTNELALKNVELEKMNKELESFTYISSHDLQEPLRKIQTFSSRILARESESLSGSGKDYFKRMQNAAGRMQRLIEDLLAFSRTTTGEMKFEKTPLNSIVTDVELELKDTINEKQAIIEVGELGEANIIPFQFRQLLHNLIGNALKFTKADTPPHITIESERITPSQTNNTNHGLNDLPAGLIASGLEYCHIRVKDKGIGFEPHFNERIFEVFQRLHGNNEYVGTGIGLAIVKKIVENHRGLITATGEPGKGATFNIYIPIF